MGPAETSDFVEGYSRRQHSGWEQTRLLADVVCKLLGGKDTGISFPWEEEDEEKSEVSPEEEAKRVEILRDMAKKLEGKL